MGLVAGIIAKALLLSLILTAVSLFVCFVYRGDFNIGLIAGAVGALLFLLLLWQGSLFFGGLLARQYEDRLLKAGEASVSTLDQTLRDLPLPSQLKEAIRSVKDADHGQDAVRDILKQTKVYLWKRVAWMVFFVVAATFVMCRVQQKTPPRRKKTTYGSSYGHYRPTENF